MTAIVPYRRGPIDVDGGRTVAQLDSNGIAVDVSIERVDRRNRCAWYAVKLGSHQHDVSGRLVAHRANRRPEEVGSVVVAAGSISSARFAVTAPRSGRYDALYLEICSDAMMLRIEAPLPPDGRRSRTKTVALRGLFIALAGGVIAAGALALPHDATLAAPAHPHAGSRVQIPYAVSAFGPVQYVAVADDGTVLSAGTSLAHSGAVAFDLPARLAAHRVDVMVRAQAAFLGASRAASFVVAAAPAPGAARAEITTFAARRDATPAGETVLASYLAVADRGTIALKDPNGVVVRAVPFGHVGTTRIAVPKAYRTMTLTAELTVHRGASRAVASVVVPPAAEAQPSASPKPVPGAGADDVTAGEAITPLDASSARNGGLISVDGRAIAGRPLALHVAPQQDAMHLDLEDQDGTSIAEIAIPAHATRAKIDLPPAAERTTYLLSLRYTRNGGEETVIRTITAAPK